MIDALQYLANAIAHRAVGDERAQDRRRRRGLPRSPAPRRSRRWRARSAEQASATGRRVELEPMSAVERRIVHEALKDDPEVETESEGAEPHRYVVVLPAPLRRLSARGGGARRLLDRWLAAVVATPGLTAIRDPDDARRVLLDDALGGLPLVGREDGPIVDVGSGGGTPGIPLAASLPGPGGDAARGRAPQVRLPRALDGRAPEPPRRLGPRRGAAARGRTASPWRRRSRDPPIAAEWCLPLVREGGAVVLWVGPTAEPERVAAVAGRVAGQRSRPPRRPRPDPQDGPDAARLPAPHGRRAEAAARLSCGRCRVQRAVNAPASSGGLSVREVP